MKKDKYKLPRPMSLVRDRMLETPVMNALQGDFVYLGEIPNMRGHGVYLSLDTRKIEVGYHTDRFRELIEGEET